jgi:hypothetical protein
MFEMFETYGKQITAFLTEARALLTENKAEVAALRVENKELKEQVTRIEGAHMLLMEWIAQIDDSEAQELADIAEAAAAEAAASAVIAEEAAEVAVEEVVKPTEEIVEQESIPPAVVEEEVKPGEEAPHLPETPVPDEPPAEPEQLPVDKKKKRFLI